ncbi:hypothetical protein PW52_10250 [Tamlana sedimentorum]|uniref:SnoaL-like domain-containing protein n=1 Tax=Neotamlana sedimentorum TaxID=1435349 RepID=A0A0D7WCI7_9FLAO|nr:hypothetical protein [Tamlana sedimentorum]KJD35467.1 hypothetical protein PW52_10250 [Tamlana sedimentorum]
MHRILITISFISVFGFISCKNSTENGINLAHAKRYIQGLNLSNKAQISDLISDSLTTVIPAYNYKVAYSKPDYLNNWLKWDSVFNPSYTILKIEAEADFVKVKVSKTDERINFFMGEPFITNEVFHFKNNKIVSIETTYLNFNEDVWETNKSNFFNWIETHDPNLKNFMYNQTETGGIKLKRAIELYRQQQKQEITPIYE